MDFSTEGIAPGGLTSKTEIRILLCYLLSSVNRPLSLTQITDIVRRDELVNYFELSDSIPDMIKSGHIHVDHTEDKEDYYTATDLGRETSETLERSLPKTVRDKTIRAATRLLARAKRDSYAKFDSTPCDNGGYTARMRILDGNDELLNLSVFLPDRAQVESVRRAFLGDPALLYKGVLALLTGDLKAVGGLIPSKDAEYYREDD